MATDYILFVHGVNTRPNREISTHTQQDDDQTRPSPKRSSYAQDLIDLIHQQNKALKQPLNIKYIPLNWYELMLDAEKQMLDWFSASPYWHDFWFKDFRQTQILPFTGDAALYISRFIGSDIANKLRAEAKLALAGCNPETDRLHLVTHSWGTVILFDILFAGRWDDPEIPGHESVQVIRTQLFGIEPRLKEGLRISSIHTMGSPIALASLIDLKRLQKNPDEKVTDETSKTIYTHDITLGLEKLLNSLYQERHTKLPWRNFIHPGDPIGYPLATVIPPIIDGQKKFLDIQDILTKGSGFLEFLARLVKWSFLALINGGSAHGSYWKNKQVAQDILEIVQNSTHKGV